MATSGDRWFEVLKLILAGVVSVTLVESGKAIYATRSKNEERTHEERKLLRQELTNTLAGCTPSLVTLAESLDGGAHPALIQAQENQVLTSCRDPLQKTLGSVSPRIRTFYGDSLAQAYDSLVAGFGTLGWEFALTMVPYRNSPKSTVSDSALAQEQVAQIRLLSIIEKHLETLK
jgi:hypothetical protein